MLHTPPVRRAARSQQGFTISELVLVLAVVAGLIMVVVVSVRGIDGDAAERECRTELRTLKAATERFRGQVGFYPPADKALEQAGFLDQSKTPNWQVITADQDAGPVYKPVGSRCD